MAENGLRFALTRREGWGLLAGGTAVGVLLFLAGVGAGAALGCGGTPAVPAAQGAPATDRSGLTLGEAAP